MYQIEDWRNFSLDIGGNYNVFEKLQILDPSIKKDDRIKWKSISNQVVLNCGKYYYKIYQHHNIIDLFAEKVKLALSEIYKLYGIEWNVIIEPCENENYHYFIEQRETIPRVVDLKECKKYVSDRSLLLLEWNKTLELLEDKLDLNFICKQLKFLIPNIYQLKLVRDNIINPADYGLYKNKLILFDDTDWFLAPVDKNGDWIEMSPNNYRIVDKSGEEWFYRPLLDTKNGELSSTWSLSKLGINCKKEVKPFMTIMDRLLESTIKLSVKNENVEFPKMSMLSLEVTK